MTRRFSLLDIATATVVAVLAAGAVWIACKGPTGPLPMHFDLSGHPDRWGDRRELALLLGFLAVVLGVTAGGLGYYARVAPNPTRRRGLQVGQLLTLLVIGAVAPFTTSQILSAADGPATGIITSPSWPMALIGFVCLATGALLGRVPPNVAVGVRTPWSLKSRLAWDRSNRLAGRLMFWLGLATLIAAPVAPQPPGVWIALGGLLLAALAAVVESWRVWRTDPERQPF